MLNAKKVKKLLESTPVIQTKDEYVSEVKKYQIKEINDFFRFHINPCVSKLNLALKSFEAVKTPEQFEVGLKLMIEAVESLGNPYDGENYMKNYKKKLKDNLHIITSKEYEKFVK